MKSYFYHLQININYSNVFFYKDLMTFLGWNIIFESSDIVGFRSETNGDLWFLKSLKDGQSDYDNVGINHISLRVGNLKDVDDTTTFLKDKKIEMLFGTPKHRPEFASDKKETYYQIMFESPDKILFEIVYIGPKE